MFDQGSRRNSDHSIVADSVLVVHADKTKNDCSSDKNENKKLDFDRLEVIKHKREEDGITTDTQKFLNQQIRPSTSKSYGYGWRVFVNWCHNNQLNPKAYELKTVLKFLVEHNHLSDQYLKVIRSAIVSVYNVLHPQQLTLSQHPLILEFFKAKRKSNIHVPELHELETWNLQLLIDLIEKWGNTEDLPIKTLQQKTLLLLGIATMWRPHSDLGRLQFRDIQFKFDQEKLVGVTLLSRKPKEANFKTSKLGVVDVTKKNLCPVRTLHMFVKKTSSRRTSLTEDHTLFLAYIEDTNAVRSVLPSTVSNWVKNHMKCAGVDIKKYKAHSLWSASSTFAVQNGNTIDSIKQHAHWSNRSNTFEQFYLKPFNSHTESLKITNSIFSSPESHTTTSECETKEQRLIYNGQTIRQLPK